MKFKEKPVLVSAYRIREQDTKNWSDWPEWMKVHLKENGPLFFERTTIGCLWLRNSGELGGGVKEGIAAGDWVVEDRHGCLTVWSNNAFRDRYEEVGPQEQTDPKASRFEYRSNRNNEIVEAFQISLDNHRDVLFWLPWPPWMKQVTTHMDPYNRTLHTVDVEGYLHEGPEHVCNLKVRSGSWLIRNSLGRLLVMKDEDFRRDFRKS